MQDLGTWGEGSPLYWNTPHSPNTGLVLVTNSTSAKESNAIFSVLAKHLIPPHVQVEETCSQEMRSSEGSEDQGISLLGLCNKVPQIERLKQDEFVVLQF